MTATAPLIDLSMFPIEVFDEAEGEVLIFDDPALLAEFEECERLDTEFDRDLVLTRMMELQDQLHLIAMELDQLIPAA